MGFHDLYISVRNPDDTWTQAVNLGPQINSATEDAAPYISPDGSYFFFQTIKAGDLGYNPYWVSSALVDSVRSTVPVRKTTWGNLKSLYRD
jgi:hypothetical protein